MQAPILDQLAEEVHEDDLKICKMDVDENPNTARQFGIMSIPTLLFKKDGQVVKQVAGVHTKAQLKEIIAELIMKTRFPIWKTSFYALYFFLNRRDTH